MHYYDDPNFSYPSFWTGREYEHRAELLALQRLLGENRFDKVADIGGGFGRLVEFLSRYARHITLVEPAEVQRRLARQFASPILGVQDGDSESTGLQTKSYDLVVMVRVMHHLTEPADSIAEMWRILKPGGLLLVEFANSNNFKSRLRYLFRFRRVPHSPVDKTILKEEDIPFVNHHPETIQRLLMQEGFMILNRLSVSNFRSPFLKIFLSPRILLALEWLVQKPFAWIYFGPSIFILAKRPLV